MPTNRENITTTFIGLGSNLGDRAANLAEAVRRLRGLEGVRITALSEVYETSPLGVKGGAFLNMVVEARTTLPPGALLHRLHRVEKVMGRVRGGKGPEPRTIDLDLLLADRPPDREDVFLPHPRLLERRFALEPLSEIAPDLPLTDAGETARRVADRLRAEEPAQAVTRLGPLGRVYARSRSGSGDTGT